MLNTGHIHMFKSSSESYDLYLSNEPKNTRIEQELVNRRSDGCSPSSCMIAQNPELELQAETWLHLQVKGSSERYNL